MKVPVWSPEQFDAVLEFLQDVVGRCSVARRKLRKMLLRRPCGSLRVELNHLDYTRAALLEEIEEVVRAAGQIYPELYG